MLKFVIFCLILNASLVPTVLGQNSEWQEALKFSNIVLSTIQNYITEALPPEARGAGDSILEKARVNLKGCETYQNVADYKACSSDLLEKSMAELGSLQSIYRRQTSGASRMSLFW